MINSPAPAARCPNFPAAWRPRLDKLDKPTTIIQPIDMPAGASLHAIRHRREGDIGDNHDRFR